MLRRILPDPSKYKDARALLTSVWSANTYRHDQVEFAGMQIPCEDTWGRKFVEIGDLRIVRVVDGREDVGSRPNLLGIRKACHNWLIDHERRAGYWGYNLFLADFRVWGALLGGDAKYRSPSQAFTDLWSAGHDSRRCFFVAEPLKQCNLTGFLKMEYGSGRWNGGFVQDSQQVDFGRGVDVVVLSTSPLNVGEESMVTINYADWDQSTLVHE